MRNRYILCIILALAGSGLLAARSYSKRSASIRQFAHRWLGTRYQWGGTSRSGIDCSAYLRQMYRDLFHVELPRTTKQQIKLGRDIPINPRNLSDGLLPGDLIFYVDRLGIPNHVVVFMGSGLINHSVSRRGVVIDPIRKLFGRRVVARRLLVPSEDEGPGGSEAFAPIPPAGPIVPFEIPCPPSFRVKRTDLRRYTNKAIPPIREFGERELCEFKVLAEALEKKGTAMSEKNAAKLREHVEWLNSLEAFKGSF